MPQKNIQKKLKTIYEVMLKEYGKQGWWPTTPVGKLIPIYSGGPKTEKQQLEIIFGSLLTQNTAWKNVKKALICLNKNKLMNLDSLLKYPHPKLAECIRSSGYHNQKAERLKIISKFLKVMPINELNKLDVKTLREILLKIKGIGPETADSIILYAFNKPTFVVDAYTKRIISRVGLCEEDVKYEDLQNIFMDSLTCDEKLFNEYHALLVEHAKRYCNVKPKCGECILRKECKKLI